MTRRVTPTGRRRPEFRTLEARLVWARETAPLTQAELAAHLGISKRTVQNYEAGVGYPSPDRLLLWCNACDADYDFVAGDFYNTPRPRGRAASNGQVTTGVNRECLTTTRRRDARNSVSCLASAA